MKTKFFGAVCFMVLTFSPLIWAMDMGKMQEDDNRQSLGIKGTMQGAHQLSNMREHLTALSEIVKYMNSDQYDEASKIATEKLGLTLEKNTMCGSFKNQSFEQMGVRFHKSADNLAQTLKTKDSKKSMLALEKVMNGCVLCHSTFKQ
ncbi:MAG: cytochrome c [Sulfuricurvum sp.]|nr:cytochrome c [Sulfuricurvum sp.]MDD5386213.1 cytochrome c [Sulfuricurvum sp.]